MGERQTLQSWEKSIWSRPCCPWQTVITPQHGRREGEKEGWMEGGKEGSWKGEKMIRREGEKVGRSELVLTTALNLWLLKIRNLLWRGLDHLSGPLLFFKVLFSHLYNYCHFSGPVRAFIKQAGQSNVVCLISLLSRELSAPGRAPVS